MHFLTALRFFLFLVTYTISAQPTSTTPPPTTSTVPTQQTAVKKNPKRGLAFADGDTPGDIDNANQTSSVISWQYNWANIPPVYLATSNIQYVPMQWGSGSIESFADSVRAQGADTILGFNEPDFVNESNMDPSDAAQLWMQFIQPLKSFGVRLGGPAVTASATGSPWLAQFFAACTNCTIDFLPLHWYGSGSSAFYDYLWSIHSQFPQYPIWITEFAETSTNDTVVAEFMNQTITYLDTLDWVERYSWFGFFRPRPDIHYNLLRDDGGLNTLGEMYTGAKTVHTQIVTNGPLVGYKTVNGADNPTQGLVTTWPAFVVNGAYRGWNILGADGSKHLLALAAVLAGSLTGALWTIW